MRIGISLGAAAAAMILFLVIDRGMSKRQIECPDPALFFELDWYNNGYFGGYDDYFDETATSELTAESAWKALEEYARLLEPFGAKVSLDDKSGTNGSDCYCLEADFGRVSLMDSRHRTVHLDYYLPEGQFFLDSRGHQRDHPGRTGDRHLCRCAQLGWHQ